MNCSSYRGKQKGSAVKARSKAYANRTFSLVLAFVLAVGLIPGLSYANSAASESQLRGEDEARTALSEQAAEPAEEQSDVEEGAQQDSQQQDQQDAQQPEPQDDQQQDQQDGQQPEQTEADTFTFPSGSEYTEVTDGEDAKITVTPSSGGAVAVSKSYSADVDTETAHTLGAQDAGSATSDITYSPSSSGTESAAIDGETRTVKTFGAAPTMTVTVSGVDFDTNKSRIKITNVLTGTVLTELWGANTWTQLDDSPTGRWQANYTIAADGRYKVEVKANGELAQTDYIDVDLIGPQVDVTFDKVGANPAGDTNYFKEWTSVTVTVRDRHFDPNSVTPRVTSPSGKPDSFFGRWEERATDPDGNVIYTSSSSNFEESAFGETYKFGFTAKDTAGHQTSYVYGDNVAADTATGAGAKTTKDSAGTALKGITGGFVVDTTRPNVAVKISSELAKHAKDDDDDDGTDYFGAVLLENGYLEATIVVTDNNFNPNADANKAISITKANGTETPIGWWALGDTEKGYDGKTQWVCTILFPQCKSGEKFSFGFTATDWAGLTTEYKYGENNEKTSDSGATSTLDGTDTHEGTDQPKELNGANFVVDVSHPNVNVTMGGARVYADGTNKVDGFNANTVTVAVDDASFDAKVTDKPTFTQPSGASGIEYSDWDSDSSTMTITLPDSKKGESYKFTLTAKDMIGGETIYSYGDNNEEATSERGLKIGRAKSTKDSAGTLVTGGSFIIDTTAPKLGVTFETAALKTVGEKTGLTRYYDGSAKTVVAKVSVFDIHLDTNDISVKVYESDGTTEASGYTVSWAAGDAEDTQVATVTISKPDNDKSYILKVTGKDQFANQIEPADSSTYVEPAAGTADAYYQSKIAFESQAPKITVGWGDTATNGKYYNAGREATITVNESNFDASLIQISQDGGSTWTTTAASDWGSDGTYTGSLKDFTADGTYTLQVKGTDLVGNPLEAGADPVDDGQPTDTQQGSVSDGAYTSAQFVIDRTAPTATIAWDNTDARDGMYYDAPRTATITVTEKNFRAGDFVVDTAGEVSGWTDDGDTHTCTVSFAVAGRYTLTVSGADLAGNAMETIVEPEFVIDRTTPAVDPNADPDTDSDTGTDSGTDTDSDDPSTDSGTDSDDTGTGKSSTTTGKSSSTTDHNDGTNSRTSGTAGTTTPHLGDGLSLPLAACCLFALLAVIVLIALPRRPARLH